MIVEKPESPYYPAYAQVYLDKLPKQINLVEYYAQQTKDMLNWLNKIPESLHDYAYEKGKWTLKDIIVHLSDTERIFQFRALCFIRNEAQSIPGFDQDAYAFAAHAKRRSLASIAQEWQMVRSAGLSLWQQLREEDWEKKGVANNNLIKVKSIAFSLLGHAIHHREVFEERYRP